MKKVLLLISAALMLAAGCVKNEPEKVDSLEITSSETQTIAVAGGTVNFTFTASGEWKAAAKNAADTWAIISPTSGAAGEGTVKVTVTPNDANDARDFVFTVTCGKIAKELTVKQAQKDGFVIATKNYTVSAEGGDVTVEFQTNASYDYTLSEEWITAKAAPAATKALEAGSVVFTVPVNPLLEERSATITFTCGEITEVVTITQEAFVPAFEIVSGLAEDNAVYFPQAGGTATIEFNTNLDVVAYLDGSQNWLTLVQDGNKVTVSAGENANYLISKERVYFTFSHCGVELEDLATLIYVWQYQKKLFTETYAWSNDYETIGITATGKNRLAYSGGYLLVSDGTNVVSVNPATGEKVMALPLPNGIVPHSFTTDDAGNVLVAVTEPYFNGTTGTELVVYTAASLTDVPQPLISWADEVYSGDATAGNLRVRGDIKKNAVITLFVPVSQYAVVWEVKDGVLGAPQYLGVTPKANDFCWSYQYGVVAPIGTTLAEGLYMGSYSAPYDLEYYNGTEWTAAVSAIMGGEGWGYALNNIHVVEFMGDKYMAHLSTSYFDYFASYLNIYKLTDAAAPTHFYQEPASVWSVGGTGYTGSWGGDVLMHAEDDHLAVFVVNAGASTISRINLKKL